MEFVLSVFRSISLFFYNFFSRDFFSLRLGSPRSVGRHSFYRTWLRLLSLGMTERESSLIKYEKENLNIPPLHKVSHSPLAKKYNHCSPKKTYPSSPSSRGTGESATFDRTSGARLTVGTQALLRKNLIFILALTLFSSTTHATEHWIFIHGTFASQSNWCRPLSTEYEALSKSLTTKHSANFKIHSFCWSGENNHPARLTAAHELIRLMETILLRNATPDTVTITHNHETATFHLVGHSHGGTVAFLAAQTLFEQKKPLKIAECFALGMPVFEGWYPDAHKQIDNLYNFFSYGDGIQRVGAIFERTFTTDKNNCHVHNIQLIFNYSCPGHLELYNPDFMKHLPTLAKLITKPGPYKLQISTKKDVDLTLTIDTERDKDLEIDKNFTKQLINILGDSRKKELWKQQ